MPRANIKRMAARLAGALSLATAVTLVPAAAQATPWPGHADRSIVRHAVRPGETATGLAVRYHAWTAELFRLNRLGSNGALYQGQVLKIPVVISAWNKAHGRTAPPPHDQAQDAGTAAQAPSQAATSTTGQPLLMHRVTPTSKRWLHADLTRDEVRHLVARTARRYEVPPEPRARHRLAGVRLAAAPRSPAPAPSA